MKKGQFSIKAHGGSCPFRLASLCCLSMHLQHPHIVPKKQTCRHKPLAVTTLLESGFLLVYDGIGYFLPLAYSLLVSCKKRTF
ncbi:hypothetical protein GDO86_012701 [Hymenochirus boettgeri]|uniref:Uncharacterized protein n=1 Tax=Hymenochirus boettgeri TaxID=247094 RepID=A0A8T2IR20_9PIPI|nr:hypothetical protein GDO86_012701 [Hymenochirus boettgeri]